MIPPSFGDLGKAARDTFTKDYNFGTYKFNVKTKTKSGMTIEANGSQCHETGTSNGNIKTVTKPTSGVELTEQWHTDNKLESTLKVSDRPLQNLSLTAAMTLQPALQPDKKSLRLKSAYKREYVNGELQVDLCHTDDKIASLLSGNILFGRAGFLLGLDGAFDVQKGALAKRVVALAYHGDGWQINTSLKNNTDMHATVHHKVRPDLQVAYMLSWMSPTNQTRFSFGMRYEVDEKSFVKAKVSNESRIGLAYGQKLRDGVLLTLSSQIDGRDFSSGHHYAGVGLEFDL